jgi:hypothetical protein
MIASVATVTNSASWRQTRSTLSNLPHGTLLALRRLARGGAPGDFLDCAIGVEAVIPIDAGKVILDGLGEL